MGFRDSGFGGLGLKKLKCSIQGLGLGIQHSEPKTLRPKPCALAFLLLGVLGRGI